MLSGYNNLAPLTVGSVSIGNVQTWDNTYWPGGVYPFVTTNLVTTITTWTCSGDVHVWACEHAVACKCGKATRQVPTCPGCGK